MKSNKIKTHVIYKKDKWNMLTVEENGSKLIVREISDQWGEDTYMFMSRSALVQWAEHKFSPGKFDGTDEEREAIMNGFRSV